MNLDLRRYQEIVERCLAIMVYYHNIGRTDESRRLMEQDVRSVAMQLALGSQPEEDEYRVHVPVWEGLVSRYGHELGPRLFSEFTHVFDEHAIMA